MARPYTTNKNSGYGNECCAELTAVPGTVLKSHVTHTSWVGIGNICPYPRYCRASVQNLQKLQVRLLTSYIGHRRWGYAYGCCANLTDVTGRNNARVITRLKEAKKNYEVENQIHTMHAV